MISPISQPRALQIFISTSTKKIVKRLEEFLDFEYEVFNVKKIVTNDFLLNYDLYFFLSPTYGDEESQEDMECFLLNLKLVIYLDGIL